MTRKFPRLASSLFGSFLLSTGTVFGNDPGAPTNRPAEGVQDNSFLIEEAYNQEPGVVQHIFNAFGSINKVRPSDERALDFLFTQEWPVFSQAHQFSYAIPYSFADNGAASDSAFGDIFLNYRFQLSTESLTRPAVAPRLSLILPTGDEDKGFGNGRLGYQFNLPVSKIVSDRWTLHANAGATFFPDVRGHDLQNYNLGVSAIYAVTPTFNLLVEAVGTWDEELDDANETERTFSAGISLRDEPAKCCAVCCRHGRSHRPHRGRA